MTPLYGAGGGSGGSGGGGGGGGGVSTATTPAQAVPSVQVTPSAQPSITPKASSVAQPSPVAQAVSPVFNKDLAKGAKNDDVKRVQQLLAQDKEIYPEGLTSGFYGKLTENAVRNFQIKYGVIKSANDPGNGKLGPKTRAKLKEVFGEETAATPLRLSAKAISHRLLARAKNLLFKFRFWIFLNKFRLCKNSLRYCWAGNF